MGLKTVVIEIKDVDTWSDVLTVFNLLARGIAAAFRATKEDYSTNVPSKGSISHGKAYGTYTMRMNHPVYPVRICRSIPADQNVVE